MRTFTYHRLQFNADQKSFGGTSAVKAFWQWFLSIQSSIYAIRAWCHLLSIVPAACFLPRMAEYVLPGAPGQLINNPTVEPEQHIPKSRTLQATSIECLYPSVTYSASSMTSNSDTVTVLLSRGGLTSIDLSSGAMNLARAL